MKEIIIIIKPDASVTIEGKGFAGADCEKATKFLEQALGVAKSSKRKPEFYQKEQRRVTQ